jgi:hypothetical protein
MESFLVLLVGRDLCQATAVRQKMADIFHELAGPNPTAIERLLVERAVACWLQVQIADLKFARANGLPVRQMEFLQARMDSAHRRYLSALRTLATVRKLALPVLRAKVARLQVNEISQLTDNDCAE